MVLAQNRHIDQWNRIESPEIHSHSYGQLIYNNWGKNIQRRKKQFNQQMVLENWTSTCRRIKLDHLLKLHTKINIKWNKDLNVRLETIKLLKKTCRQLFDTSLSNTFVTIFPQARETKAKISKWKKNKKINGTTSKQKTSGTQTSTERKGNLLSGRRYLQRIHPIKRYIQNILSNILDIQYILYI